MTHNPSYLFHVGNKQAFPPRECEVCGRSFSPRFDPDDTMCAKCDTAGELAQRIENKQKKKEWAAKHKCQRCGKGLPLHKQVMCVYCAMLWPKEEFYSEKGGEL